MTGEEGKKRKVEEKVREVRMKGRDEKRIERMTISGLTRKTFFRSF